ncbi:TetR/AcrR family transcriptional regulator [Arthrobacter sp. D1-29]
MREATLRAAGSGKVGPKMTTTPKILPIRQRQREMTRDAILAAALDAFSEQGFFFVSIDDIVQRAGISRTTFYLHFTDKSAALRALRDKRLAEWGESDSYEWIKDQESAEAFFTKMVDFYLETPELHKTLHQARAADPEFAAAHQQSMEEQLALLAENPAMRDATEEQRRMAIAMLYSMIDHFLYVWLIQGWKLDRSQAIKAMANAMSGVLT